MRIHDRRATTNKYTNALQTVLLTVAVQAIGVVLLLGFFELN